MKDEAESLLPSLIAITILVLQGCGNDSSEEYATPSPDDVVWWTPVASYFNHSLDQKVMECLGEKEVRCWIAGSRSTSVRVPYKDHVLALATLKESPFAEKLRISSIYGGPRPSGKRTLLVTSLEDCHWESVTSFDPNALPWKKVEEVLHARDVECGFAKFTYSESLYLYVPPYQKGRAFEALKASPFKKAFGWP